MSPITAEPKGNRLLKLKQKLTVRFQLRLAVACLFISTFSLPGSESIAGGGQAYSYQIYVKGILLCLPLVLFQNKSWLDSSLLKNNLFFLILGLYGIVTCIWSPMPVYTLIRSLSLIILILGTTSIFYVYRTTYEEYYHKLLFDLFLITGCGVLFFTVLGVFDIEIGWRKVYLPNTILKRLGGDILPPNTLGAVAALHLILAFKHGFDKKYLFPGSLVSSGYVLAQSNSRSAIVSLVFAVLVIIVIKSFAVGDLKKVSFLFISIAVFVGSLLFIDSKIIETKAINLSRYEDLEEYRTLTGRTYIWERIFSQQKIILMTGNGYGVLSDNGYIVAHSIITTNAHNGFLQILAGTGIIGLLLFFIYFVQLSGYAIIMVRDRLRDNDFNKIFWTLLSVIIYVLINNLAESSFGSQIVPQLIVFLFISMLLINSSIKSDV